MPTKREKTEALKQKVDSQDKITSPKKQTRVRLIKAISDKIREQYRFQGDLSTKVEEAIAKVNLDKVNLVDFRGEGGSADDTTISVDAKLYEKWQKAQHRRGASMNLLVNSALADLLKLDVRHLGDDDDSN